MRIREIRKTEDSVLYSIGKNKKGTSKRKAEIIVDLSVTIEKKTLELL